MPFEPAHVARKETKADSAAAVAVDQGRQFLPPVVVGREEIRLMLTGGGTRSSSTTPTVSGLVRETRR